jgi:flagellar hook protein FlgE
MSFYTSLSGLQAAQTDMSTISHNLANVATNGFKKSRSEFADVMASNFTTDPRHMVGSGVVLQQNKQEFGEGNLRSTTSSLDLAISGDGFFAVKSPSATGGISYTRNGSFTVDPGTHQVVDSQGSYLQAYPVDAQGNVTATGADGLTNVTIPAVSGAPIATSSVALGVTLSTEATKPASAFNPVNASTYNNATSTKIYDADGNAMTMTNYYVRTPGQDANGNSAWEVYSYVGDQQLTSGGSTQPTPVTFDSTGALVSPSGVVSYDAFTPTGSGTPQSLALDLSGSTSKATTYSVVSRSQDGASVGEFSGVTVDPTGLITASFSNGESRALGRVAVATFTDPTGLKQTGGTYWQSTGLSGAATLTSPQEGSAGKLMSSTLEGSNVDITEELVNLISAQRNFQANAKALDTQTQISQTIFNIRS